MKSVADVTTKSPEAYRAYVEGLDDFEKVYWKEANSAFEQAVALDKNFAMAYYYLSNTQGILGETEESHRSLQKAVELSDKTTERERLQILASNYGDQNNLPKAIESYEQLIDRYPHEIAPYIDLGFVIDDDNLLDPQKAVEVLRGGLNVNPTERSLWNVLAYSYARLNQKQEALDAVNQYIKLAPAEPNPYDTQGDIYAWFMDYDSSRAAYQYATSLRRDFDAYKLGFDALLRQNYSEAQNYFQMSGYQIGSGVTTAVQFPLIEIEKGQINDAQKKLSEILNTRLSQGERLIALAEMVHLCYETNEYPEMLRFANELSTEYKKDPSNQMHERDYVAWALVKNGKAAEAENLLQNMQKDLAGSPPATQVRLMFASALIYFDEGKYSIALDEFKKAYQILPPNHGPNIFYAICLLKNGQTSDAVNELQRLVYWPATSDNYLLPGIPGAIGYWPIQSVKAHYWLGVAYEQQGYKDKAINEYKKFLDIWKDADFKSPEVADARQQITKLQ